MALKAKVLQAQHNYLYLQHCLDTDQLQFSTPVNISTELYLISLKLAPFAMALTFYEYMHGIIIQEK